MQQQLFGNAIVVQALLTTVDNSIISHLRLDGRLFDVLLLAGLPPSLGVSVFLEAEVHPPLPVSSSSECFIIIVWLRKSYKTNES